MTASSNKPPKPRTKSIRAIARSTPLGSDTSGL
jgi:hypothetical protein